MQRKGVLVTAAETTCEEEGKKDENRTEEEEMRREQSEGKRCMQHCLIHPFFLSH